MESETRKKEKCLSPAGDPSTLRDRCKICHRIVPPTNVRLEHLFMDSISTG